MTIEKITVAKLLKLEQEKSIELSEDFFEALKPEDGQFAVIILNLNRKSVRIIPTSTEKIYKVSINIDKLAQDFFQKVSNLFYEMNIKSLYSTGLCFVDNKCVYDLYIDSVEYEKIDEAKLKDNIMKIDGITTIDIESISV
ncbi:MAG: hypothetical protein FK733_08765 [Asgard group archaeon]|nr:hypothetical protein [Asgard group archaeon]